LSVEEDEHDIFVRLGFFQIDFEGQGSLRSALTSLQLAFAAVITGFWDYNKGFAKIHGFAMGQNFQ